MEKITSTTELKALIFTLEQKHKEDERLFKEQLLIVAQGLKPGNIIKSTFLDLSKNTGIADSLLNTSLSFAAGYVSKKLMLGDTHNNPLKKTLGMILQVGISSIISKNTEGIKSGLKQVFSLFSSKNGTSD